MDQELATFLAERFDDIGRHFGDVHRRFDIIGRRFDVIDERFDAVDRRFEAIDQRFETVDRRLYGMDQRFDTLDRRFDAMDQRFDVMDRRVDAVDQRIDEKFEEAKRYFGVLADNLRGDIGAVAEGYAGLERRIQALDDRNEVAHRQIIGLLSSSHQELDRRVTRLESKRPRGGSRRRQP